MRKLTNLAVVVAASAALLSACGGGDTAPTTDPAGSQAPSSSKPDAPSQAQQDADEMMLVGDVQHESKNVGFDVMDYAIKNNFTNPASQADFEKNVKYAKSLRQGSKVGYEPMGKDSFRVCVVHYEGSEPQAWAIFDATSGLAEGEVGAPTEQLCP